MSGCRRRAGDEKRFDEKMERGCDGVGGCGRWLEAAAAVGRRGEFAGRGRRGASVVRHEKMVIPSRMCPMHMHVFPQNGWPGCGGAEVRKRRAGGRTKRGGQGTRRGIEMTEREAEKEEAVDVEAEEEEEVTLRLATGKKSMSSPPALALSVLSSDSTLCYLHRAK